MRSLLVFAWLTSACTKTVLPEGAQARRACTSEGMWCQDESHAPLYGEHTREILGELGYGAPEIDKMIAAKAATDAAKS